MTKSRAQRLRELRVEAAKLGCLVRPATEMELDRLDIIAELGGEATALEMVCHTGRGTPQNVHTRLRVLLRLGAFDQSGDGKNASPYRYKLTQIGELLRENR